MTPSQLIDQEIAATPGWRGELYDRLRKLINQTAPSLVEQWKWNSAIFRGKKDVISLSPFKEHVKINFFKGAHLDTPQDVFNNGLDSNNFRSIDFREHDPVDETLIKNIIQTAVAYDSR
jgi:hypothetical protein